MATGNEVSSSTVCVQAPVIDSNTRVLTISTLVLSVLVHTKMVSMYYWPFLPQFIFRLPPKIPEIWRLYTSFCLTGPGFGIFMDSYFGS